MLKILTVLLLLFITYFCAAIIVRSQVGDIKGSERKSKDGRTYYAFTGIPYAEPPLGKLRLKNPVKIEAWNGVLDGTKEAPKCLQTRMLCLKPPLRNRTIGQEDCLYLNVYTPQVLPEEKLPVMIHIEEGGFRCGVYGLKDNPDYIVDQDVVMVNFHYRLGALGFLSTEDRIIPGNFGLKDQAMALRWVKNNVEAFGGDPEKITLFGHNAGGASAHYHMISPLSKDMIKGVISQSGVINDVWSVGRPGTAIRLTINVAEKLGCYKKLGIELLDCLQNVPAADLIRSELDFLFWDFEPLMIFKPMREPDEEEAFLPFDPLTRETRVPWITGIVDKEGIFKLGSLLAQEEAVTRQLIENIDEFLPKLLNADRSRAELKRSVRMIKDRYFLDLENIHEVQIGAESLFADVNFVYPMFRAMKRHKGPLFQYLYDYTAVGDVYGDFNLGVNHRDDLLTSLDWAELIRKDNKQTEEAVTRTMVKLWTNFAKYQKPTTKEDTVQWPEVGAGGNFMHISDRLSVKRHLQQDLINWWDKLLMFKKIPDKTEL